MSLDDDARDELAKLEAEHRLRVPRVVDGALGPRVVVDGREVVNLASNDYLSLAGDRRLVAAAERALEESGAGAGASRLIVGNQRELVALEQDLADWLRCGGVRLFNSGFVANVGVITTLARAGDVVFSDELNHASIIDGCRLARADVVVVPHLDLGALDAALAKVSARRKLVVTETLFSMDGDIADVEGLARVCKKHEAALILDEAHAIGCWGPEGRGIAASVGVVPDVMIGTCGKALGSFGAFAATSRAIADLLWNRARPLVFSTGLPSSVAASVRAAIEIVRGHEGDERRATLFGHAAELRRRVPKAGGAAGSAIAPVLVGDDRRVMQISRALFERGVFVQGIRPPTVPVGTARLRVSLCSGVTRSDLEAACDAMQHECGS